MVTEKKVQTWSNKAFIPKNNYKESKEFEIGKLTIIWWRNKLNI